MHVEFRDMIDGERSVTDGPFDYVQLTYHQIRVSPEGDMIGYYDPETRDWWRVNDESGRYTDIVITPA